MATILHLDMDAFFASVEQHDDPSLKGLPVIIGHDHRGVVSAASYEARVFGVRSAMPVTEARRRCPQGVFLPGNRRRYSEVSRVVMHTLGQFSPLVEPASIDEAYVDITGTETLFGPPETLARAIKEAEVVAFPELGPEAIYRLTVEDFPVTVVIDSTGADLYKIGQETYKG